VALRRRAPRLSTPTVVVANILVDLAYAGLDPRVPLS
jgi:ABC-type dipeptide/oligopeptide/nickel transport system permease component